MSIFKNLTKTKYVFSTLIDGDAKIVLKFKPLGLEDQVDLAVFQEFKAGEVNKEKMVEGFKIFCASLAKKIVESKIVQADGTFTIEENPTEADFLEMMETNFLSIVEIMNDFIPKKTVVETSSKD
jgi:hypothetical protein